MTIDKNTSDKKNQSSINISMIKMYSNIFSDAYYKHLESIKNYEFKDKFYLVPKIKKNGDIYGIYLMI